MVKTKKATKEAPAPKPPLVDEYARTPFGIGVVYDKSLQPVYQEYETGKFNPETGNIDKVKEKVYYSDPYVDVYVAPDIRRFSPDEVTTATKAEFEAQKASKEPKRVSVRDSDVLYAQTRKKPKGKYEKVLKRMDKTFRMRDIIVAVDEAIKAKELQDTLDPQYRANKYRKEMLRDGLIEVEKR